MVYAITGLQVLLAIGSLICLILVIMKMFQHGQTGLGIVCIVLVFCFFIGGLVTFIVGWVNSARWGIKNIMLAWTGCIVASLVLSGIGAAMGVGLPGLPR